jgi:hypothetical protein
MANLNQTTTTDLNNANLDYSTPNGYLDEESNNEIYWNNDYWEEGLGLWEDNPAYKEPIRALARWTIGKGYTTEDPNLKVILDRIRGSGEDCFQSIMTNHIIVKKTNGDAYTQIIRNEKGTLINLKPLNPSNVRIVWDKKGMISGYDLKKSDGTWERKKPFEIFHSMNDRIASQIHGTPTWQACKWELETRKEVLANTRRILQRGTIRVIYVDEDNTTKLNQIKTEWKDAIKYGEVMLLPGKRGSDVEVVDYAIPDITALMTFVQYLDNKIYQSLGVPRAIADTSEFSEAASKVGYMTFEPAYTEEQTLLEQDLKNQVGIELKCNRPPSLAGTMQDSEEKNTGQVGFQPNDSRASITRTE